MELTPQMCTNCSYILHKRTLDNMLQIIVGTQARGCLCVFVGEGGCIALHDLEYTAHSSPENLKSRLEEEKFKNVAIESIAG